jgi:hypothetical protein
LLNEYSAAMEARTPSVSAPYYADDITSKFANAPVVTGRDGVLAQMADVLTRVRSLGTSSQRVGGGRRRRRLRSRQHLESARRVITIRACSVFTLTGGKFVDQRIYVDNAPVNEALG